MVYPPKCAIFATSNKFIVKKNFLLILFALMSTKVQIWAGGIGSLGLEHTFGTYSYKYHHERFTSLALTYSKSYSLTFQHPLYLECGAGAQYSFFSKGDDGRYYLSVKVPVNVVYSIKIHDLSFPFSINPFAGLRWRVNIWGKEYEEYYDDVFRVNLFNRNETDWKRMQMGWTVGVKAAFYHRFFVGMSYGSDFTEMAEHMKVREASLSLGVIF